MIMGNNVFLRGLVLDDVDGLFNYWNNNDFMNYSGRINPYSKEELINWIQTTWNEREQKKVFTFAIIEVNEKVIIGTIRLKIVNMISRRADISIGIFNPIPVVSLTVSVIFLLLFLLILGWILFHSILLSKPRKRKKEAESE